MHYLNMYWFYADFGAQWSEELEERAQCQIVEYLHGNQLPQRLLIDTCDPWISPFGGPRFSFQKLKIHFLYTYFMLPFWI
jgi:hypothetical protein